MCSQIVTSHQIEPPSHVTVPYLGMQTDQWSQCEETKDMSALGRQRVLPLMLPLSTPTLMA